MNYQQIPLELWLATLTRGNCYSLWNDPALSSALESLPEHGTLFYIEHTTAASGPTILWYPLSAWQAEQERQLAIDKLVEQQYVNVRFANEARKQELIAQIRRAKQLGDIDLIQELRKELNKL